MLPLAIFSSCVSLPALFFLPSFPPPSLSSAGLPPPCWGFFVFPAWYHLPWCKSFPDLVSFHSSLIVSGLAYLYSSPVLIEQNFFFIFSPYSSIALFFSTRHFYFLFFLFSYSACRFWLRERHFSSIPKLNRRSKKRLLFPRVCRSTPSPLQLLAPSIAKNFGAAFASYHPITIYPRHLTSVDLSHLAVFGVNLEEEGGR